MFAKVEDFTRPQIKAELVRCVTLAMDPACLCPGTYASRAARIAQDADAVFHGRAYADEIEEAAQRLARDMKHAPAAPAVTQEQYSAARKIARSH